MKRLALVVLACTATPAFAADARHPTVVELFQSQGCSSCPPANANVMALADRPDILALSWQVTYWDRLGWKDSFASPAFTSRQWDYAHAFHRDEVATPEVVVNGRADVVGSDRAELAGLIGRSDRGEAGPAITVAGDRAAVAGPAAGSGGILLVRYDPAIIAVPIRAGENAGRTLPHRNVVREIVSLGRWNGGRATYPLPAPSRPGLATAILLQESPGGPILAAARA